MESMTDRERHDINLGIARAMGAMQPGPQMIPNYCIDRNALDEPLKRIAADFDLAWRFEQIINEIAPPDNDILLTAGALTIPTQAIAIAALRVLSEVKANG